MLHGKLALWVWSSEESSRLGRTQIGIITAVRDSPQGVDTAVPAPPPESCLISPNPSQKEGENVEVFRWVGAKEVLVRGEREEVRVYRESIY